MEPHVHKDEDTPSSKYFSMKTTIKNNSFMKSIRGCSQRYKSRSITFSKEAPKTTNQPPEKPASKQHENLDEWDDQQWFPEISLQTLEHVMCGCPSCRNHHSTCRCNSGQYSSQDDEWKPLTRISTLSTSTNIQSFHQEEEWRRSVHEGEKGSIYIWNPILPHVPTTCNLSDCENNFIITNFGKHVEVDSLDVSIPSATQQQETTPSPDQSQILHNETSSLLENPLIGSKEKDKEPELGILSPQLSNVDRSQRRELFPWLSSCKQKKIQKPKKMLRPLEIPKKSIPLVRK
ncbi:hypothetical protein C9374_006280 [Naegleria lovaniensis]|uniref:Uncharacterized protein n=1 Tax=Naegleria lovaniensis TaxID=51637 RepID=A0AA88KMB6_NAELO|nr:uncharacterized protein C9374_006280 [Naegleria lovaniensis]KAG2381291.1 hypothetical protein C9374_006280 [Naegleria lovaniensis]